MTDCAISLYTELNEPQYTLQKLLLISHINSCTLGFDVELLNPIIIKKIQFTQLSSLVYDFAILINIRQCSSIFDIGYCRGKTGGIIYLDNP